MGGYMGGVAIGVDFNKPQAALHVKGDMFKVNIDSDDDKSIFFNTTGGMENIVEGSKYEKITESKYVTVSGNLYETVNGSRIIDITDNSNETYGKNRNLIINRNSTE